MSEKRFQLNMRRNPSKILDNGKVISKYNAVVLLNKFYKEIQTLKEENEQLRNKLEVANARSSYYQRMLKKWCVK